MAIGQVGGVAQDLELAGRPRASGGAESGGRLALVVGLILSAALRKVWRVD